jgi:hypothetical protein
MVKNQKSKVKIQKGGRFAWERLHAKNAMVFFAFIIPDNPSRKVRKEILYDLVCLVWFKTNSKKESA